MLLAEQRNRFTVVLVGARNPSNIGAAARAMQDFGFSDLRFVNDFTAPFEAAQLEAKSAVGAGHVMRAARRFASVAEALADCTLAVGTTAIGGRIVEQPLLALAEAAPRMRGALQQAESARVALLFGSEKTGLTNDQLSHCHWLTTIPMFAPEGERHLSMNLGQSVAVCLYELVREGFEGVRELPTQRDVPLLEPAVSGGDRERLTLLLIDVMQRTGYARRFPANAREQVVRQLAQRLTQDPMEAQTWFGLLRIIARHASTQEESPTPEAQG